MPNAMRRFWDRRAREDPFYFVDNRLEYGRPDVDAFWRAGEEELDRLLALGGEIRPADVVVDIGCGIGRLTRAIARRAGEVVAIDVSPRMLELGAEHNADLDNVRWTLGDGRTLSAVETGSADACVSFVVLQHLPEPELVLGYVREMGRVLKPGGWAAFQVSNDPAVHRRPAVPRRFAANVVGALRRRPGGQANPAWLGCAVSVDEVRAAAAGAGMEVERVEGEATQFCLVLTRRVPVSPGAGGEEPGG